MPPAFSPVEVTAASFTQPRNCVFFACAAIPAAVPLALAVPVTRMFLSTAPSAARKRAAPLPVDSAVISVMR